MFVRRCATPRCTGALPAGKGKHCPRCGGTAFLPPSRPSRGLLLAALVVVAVTGSLFALRAVSVRRPIPVERRPLMEGRDVAARMTLASDHDEAYAKLIHRALAIHDFEYACELAGEITMSQSKDQSLLEIVNAALAAHEPQWASRAADQIVMSQDRDLALKKILDAGSQK